MSALLEIEDLYARVGDKEVIKNDISRAGEFLYYLHYIRKFHVIPFPI